MRDTHEMPRRALLQMIVGAIAISSTSLFVKVAHVGPTMSLRCRSDRPRMIVSLSSLLCSMRKQGSSSPSRASAELSFCS